ncbi:MAG: metallophosphoesterase family protein [Candidatus Hodarchaeales archaeon]|jgi:putative phosphoesterase
MESEFNKRLETLGVPPTFVDVFWKQAQKSILSADHKTLDKPVLIFSDIHGNLPALELAMQFSQENGISKLISLGDMVDYNRYNNEVLIKILNYQESFAIIRGNHDSFFLDNSSNYRTKIDQQKIERELVEKVKNLNAVEILSVNGFDLLLCHSNPWGLDSYYIFPTDNLVLDYFLFNMPLDGFIYGHTHMANFYCSKNKLAFNPGSLGQSRGKNEDLTFAWLDPEEEMITFFSLDVEKRNPTVILDEEPKLVKKVKIDFTQEINYIY